MMLTWKICVAIISMVSLTLQMETSNTGSSSDSSGFFDPGSPWVTDTADGRHYPHLHINYNPFKKGNNAYACYAFIRLFCGTLKNDDVTSDDCAKQGIFLYKRDELTMDQLHIAYNPYAWAYDFFENLELAVGEFDFPNDFCAGKGSECNKVLKKYTGKHLLRGWSKKQLKDPDNKKVIRDHIAWFALHKRDLYDLERDRIAKKITYISPKKDFEREYLKHISAYVSSGNPNHTPFNKCIALKNNTNEYNFSVELTKHLGLNPETED